MTRPPSSTRSGGLTQAATQHHLTLVIALHARTNILIGRQCHLCAAVQRNVHKQRLQIHRHRLRVHRIFPHLKRVVQALDHAARVAQQTVVHHRQQVQIDRQLSQTGIIIANLLRK